MYDTPEAKASIIMVKVMRKRRTSKEKNMEEEKRTCSFCKAGWWWKLATGGSLGQHQCKGRAFFLLLLLPVTALPLMSVMIQVSMLVSHLSGFSHSSQATTNWDVKQVHSLH